jgi:hypothetical protein
MDIRCADRRVACPERNIAALVVVRKDSFDERLLIVVWPPLISVNSQLTTTGLLLTIGR